MAGFGVVDFQCAIAVIRGHEVTDGIKIHPVAPGNASFGQDRPSPHIGNRARRIEVNAHQFVREGFSKDH